MHESITHGIILKAYQNSTKVWTPDNIFETLAKKAEIYIWNSWTLFFSQSVRTQIQMSTTGRTNQIQKLISLWNVHSYETNEKCEGSAIGKEFLFRCQSLKSWVKYKKSTEIQNNTKTVTSNKKIINSEPAAFNVQIPNISQTGNPIHKMKEKKNCSGIFAVAYCREETAKIMS